jgi:exopolyphosphatase/guanosine-5'-triphosphate,3'-diphosphate pyrophosphatase
MSIITTIDLGSNSFRVLQYNCDTNNIINQYETVVGTANNITKTKKISTDALNNIINAIKHTQTIFKFNPTDVIAVTTQAMRQATNSQDILKTIKKQTGVDFNIIDGQKEANLTLLAVKYALKRENIKSDNFILIDIGGGSTEVIIYSNKQVYSKSFELGIITLTQSLNKKQSFINFTNSVKQFINSLNLKLANYNFISTAGTPTTIAALKNNLNYKTYDSSIVNGTIVTLDDCKHYKNILLNCTKQEAIDLVGSGRIEYLESGINIFEKFYEIFSKTQSIVFDDGLREGVAIDWCIKNS